MNDLTKADLQRVITQRPPKSHKGDYGRVVIIAGDAQYSGAAIMAGFACVCSGAGLVTVVSHPQTHAPLLAHCPEAMFVAWNDEPRIHQVLAAADILLIGPGLGLSSHALYLLKTVLARQSIDQWLIIDGSAIPLLAQSTLALRYPQQTIFTPHQMEWQRLSGLAIAKQTQANNQRHQQQLGAHIVLKSHRTQIYSPLNQFANPLGHPAMATGGMGDTLAGMIAGFFAQFPREAQTIGAAVYLHSYIGEQLAKKHYVVLPTQLSQQIPYWMNYFATN